jgi:Zn-dependent protease with chaperone function
LFEEEVRLQTNHLSYRAFYLPWSRHAVAVLSAGTLLFWMAALVRWRARRFESEADRNALPMVDLRLR